MRAAGEALRAAGATYGQIVAQAVIPMSITSVVSWVLYMIETNIRDATPVSYTHLDVYKRQGMAMT